MIDIDTYRIQHDGLLEIAGEISKHLDISSLRQDERKVHSLLNQLAGKLNVHLAMEDNSLYPKLLEHPQENVRSVTLHYMQEMGNMANAFKRYMDTWKVSQTIQDEPDEFILQTDRMIVALRSRIERENSELYHLAEEAGPFDH